MIRSNVLWIKLGSSPTITPGVSLLTLKASSVKEAKVEQSLAVYGQGSITVPLAVGYMSIRSTYISLSFSLSFSLSLSSPSLPLSFSFSICVCACARARLCMCY